MIPSRNAASGSIFPLVHLTEPRLLASKDITECLDVSIHSPPAPQSTPPSSLAPANTRGVHPYFADQRKPFSPHSAVHRRPRTENQKLKGCSSRGTLSYTVNYKGEMSPKYLRLAQIRALVLKPDSHLGRCLLRQTARETETTLPRENFIQAWSVLHFARVWTDVRNGRRLGRRPERAYRARTIGLFLM